jgi:Tfp pilus assembly protein PilO
MDMDMNVDIFEQLGKYKNVVINLVIVFVALGVAYNIYEKQDKVVRELADQKDAEAKKTGVMAEIQELYKKLESVKTTVNKKDVSRVMNNVASVARDHSIQILSMRPAAPTSFELYTRYPFEVNILAQSYADLGKFVSELENHPDVYFTETLDISPVVSEDKQTGLRVATTIFTILLK